MSRMIARLQASTGFNPSALLQKTSKPWLMVCERDVDALWLAFFNFAKSNQCMVSACYKCNLQTIRLPASTRTMPRPSQVFCQVTSLRSTTGSYIYKQMWRNARILLLRLSCALMG